MVSICSLINLMLVHESLQNLLLMPLIHFSKVVHTYFSLLSTASYTLSFSFPEAERLVLFFLLVFMLALILMFSYCSVIEEKHSFKRN